jgi:hypothetical protein
MELRGPILSGISALAVRNGCDAKTRKFRTQADVRRRLCGGAHLALVLFDRGDEVAVQGG